MSSSKLDEIIMENVGRARITGRDWQLTENGKDLKQQIKSLFLESLPEYEDMNYWQKEYDEGRLAICDLVKYQTKNNTLDLVKELFEEL